MKEKELKKLLKLEEKVLTGRISMSELKELEMLREICDLDFKQELKESLEKDYEY